MWKKFSDSNFNYAVIDIIYIFSRNCFKFDILTKIVTLKYTRKGIDQLVLPYQFYGRYMMIVRNVLFHFFRSCEPLKKCKGLCILSVNRKLVLTTICENAVTIQRVSKKWCIWKCAITINNCSIFFTAFYRIFKITKSTLKYRLFHHICFCHSQDMFVFSKWL